MARSIRTRILAVFALSLAAFGGALGYGLVQLRSIGEGLVAIDVGYLPLAEQMADLQSVSRQMDRDAARFAREGLRPVEGHRSNAAFYHSTLRDALARSRGLTAAARAATDDPLETEAFGLVDGALEEIERHRAAHERAVQSWEEAAGLDLDAQTAAFVEMDRRQKELATSVRKAAALVQGRITAVSERTARAQDQALAVSGALSLLAALLAGVMAAVALVTLRPIGTLTAQVQRMAAGDRAARVDVRATDEVGLLAREFNAMAEAVAERDQELVERAEALDRLSLQLRRVLDTIHSGLVVIEDKRVVLTNPAAHELWGVELDAMAPERLATLSLGRHEALSIAERRFAMAVVPYGERGVLLVGEDVTERDQVRERLIRSQRLALVGQMLAQVTHEVRNPLNAMSLNAELLAEELQSAEQQAMLGTIVGEIARLEQVTARYLDLSRRRTPEVGPEDPMALVRAVAQVEQEALRRAGVELEVVGDSPGVIDLDGDALRRAVRNLVRNAVEAGAKHVRIGVGAQADQLQITVHDDGSGMDATELERAFEPFYTTKAKGTGLGLAITRQELEDLGGGLVGRHVDTGTAFVVTIPLRAAT